MRILPFTVLAGLLVSVTAGASGRIVRSINEQWKYTQEGVSRTVNIPHCINADDTWDEVKGYWRGKSTYERTVRINDCLDGKKVYARFEGVGQEAELFVNGTSVGTHKGGYTAFIFDITDAVTPGDNEFLVKVDNTYNPDIPPLNADFTFYGGIYRDVSLVILPENHISVSHFASSGVYLTTPRVGSTSTVNARVFLDVRPAEYRIRHCIYAPDGSMAAVSESTVTADGDASKPFDQQFTVNSCKLWDVDDPNVYRVVTTLLDAGGNELDSVENPLGFRSFSFDVEKGFTLNGRSLKIMGTNRHQDILERGNALSDEDHLRDIMLVKEMGGNFLRISHYPQDRSVAQTCDREGLVASIEIPIIDYITESEAFRENCIVMAQEMVCQSYNHPSVIIWAYMNESMQNVPYPLKKEPEKRRKYFETSVRIAQGINDAIKELDPYRPTMIPCESNPDRYIESGVGQVPDILGWNHYQGWYSNAFEDFEAAVTKEHEMFPDKPLIVTEYGAGIDPRLHSSKPVRFDFSMEYGVAFHRHYLDVIRRTPWIAGSNVWNLNDFYSEVRVDAVPHVNNKGLVGLDRTPKDSYLFYQAQFLPRPFIAISGRDWRLRAGNEGEHFSIDVYTNASRVTLFHNGRKVGAARVSGAVASFDIVPVDGENIIAAKAPGGLRDAVRFKYSAVPSDMSRFTVMNVSLGTDCQFEDAIQGAAWMPEQPYREGSWGYVGGEKLIIHTGNRDLPGTNADILGTINNPIFQTQRKDIRSFRADVPDGSYIVSLYFAEVDSKRPERVFNVLVNGEKVLADYNISAEEGAFNAVIRKFEVDVKGGRGIDVSFEAVKGEPVLNAIRIFRCF